MRHQTCNPRPLSKGTSTSGKITVLNLLVVAGLLALPLLALRRLTIDWRLAAAYVGTINLLCFCLYATDKRRAVRGEWRVPEQSLHLLELLGGWPGAFLGQRRLRHKCSKGSYQIIFWLIVLAWQLAAADSLQNWKFSKATMNRIESIQR